MGGREGGGGGREGRLGLARGRRREGWRDKKKRGVEERRLHFRHVTSAFLEREKEKESEQARE